MAQSCAVCVGQRETRRLLFLNSVGNVNGFILNCFCFSLFPLSSIKTSFQDLFSNKPVTLDTIKHLRMELEKIASEV